MANATPMGTAMMVVRTDSRMVWTTALRSAGSWATELTGSPQYQRVENPCQTLWDLPLLKEKRTAMAMGTMDQSRYSQVKPSRIQGRRHGLRQGGRRRDSGRGRRGRGRGGSGRRGAAVARSTFERVPVSVIRTPPPTPAGS